MWKGIKVEDETFPKSLSLHTLWLKSQTADEMKFCSSSLVDAVVISGDDDFSGMGSKKALPMVKANDDGPCDCVIFVFSLNKLFVELE